MILGFGGLAATIAGALVLGPVAGPAGLPRTVPPASATTSVITVRTGGERVSPSAIGVLPGARLVLFAAETDTEPLPDGWARCVSDADGDCSFVVPDTGVGGTNAGRRFWIGQQQDGTPAGWYANLSLRTGKGSGSSSVATPYRFGTPALNGGQTYSSTAEFMKDDTKGLATASGGIWQQSRVNPPLPRRCGLDVGLVLDLSSSVGSALPELKRAADTLTDALVGTPSRMALFTFDKGSPSAGTVNRPALKSVSTPAGATSFKNQYAGWALGSGTNWDAGLWAVSDAAPDYELVVVLTDGNPTYRGVATRGGDGSTTRISEVEGGIFAANAIKARGSRVLTVGVGKGLDAISGQNLRAISGPNLGDPADLSADADYFQTSDYDEAGKALHQLVLRQCAGSLSIIKQLVPKGNKGEDVTGAVNAPRGWSFTAATATPGVTGLPDTQTTTTDGTGSVTFEPTYTSASTASLSVTEDQQPGYQLVTRAGKNAECVDLSDGSPVAVADTGSAGSGSPGFTVTTQAGGAISCTVYNRPPADPVPPRGTTYLTLVKKVRGGAAEPGSWTLRATGPQTVAGRSGSARVTRVKVRPGTYKLSETGGPPGYRPSTWTCRAPGRTLPVHDAAVTLPRGTDATCTIVNTRKHRTRPGKKHPAPACRAASPAACRPDPT